MSKLHVIKLEKGQDVKEGLKQYMMDKDWKGAVIVAAAGSLRGVTLSNPISDTPPSVLLPITVDVPCEIMSFTGELIRKDDTPKSLSHFVQDDPCNYIVHIHASISHGSGVVNGGGLRAATVHRALNIYVLELEE